jgi:hypothetical protein
VAKTRCGLYSRIYGMFPIPSCDNPVGIVTGYNMDGLSNMEMAIYESGPYYIR